MPNKKMCVIGFGRMGKRAAKLFSEGFEVEVISSRNVESELVGMGAKQSDDVTVSLSSADFIFLTIPVDAIKTWVARINQTSREDCTVIDCCTARLASERELAPIDRKRFGMPEFSPRGVVVVGQPDRMITQYLTSKGCQLNQISPEQADKKTGPGLAQFVGMALDLHLDESQRSQLRRSKAGSYLLQLIHHLKSNSSSTYRETQILNPYMSDARKKLIKSFLQFDEELDDGVFRFEAFPRDRWRE